MNRTVLFSSIDESNTEIIDCYPANTPTTLVVIASVGSYYLGTDGNISGFVRQDDGYLMDCLDTYRHYDCYMEYYEELLFPE